MSKPIMFYYQAIIERKMLVEEYNKFTDLLNSSMRDSSYVYDENEKIVYLFKQILGESGEVLYDPCGESEPISFYERIKRIIYKNERYVLDQITEGLEKRIYAKDQKVFLDQIYIDCINLINKYPESNHLKDYPIIIDSLKRVKEFIEDKYKLVKVTLPTEIKDSTVFKRKLYHKLPNHDELILAIKELKNQPRFKNKRGRLKPTTIHNYLLDDEEAPKIEGINDIEPRSLFTRVKDAIKEIEFYEVKSTS